MFCGMGRLLGSILGGPLGTLGRPPGGSKLTRIFSHSLDNQDDDSETMSSSGLEPIQFTSTIIRRANRSNGRWLHELKLFGFNSFLWLNLSHDKRPLGSSVASLQNKQLDDFDASQWSSVIKFLYSSIATPCLKSVLTLGDINEHKTCYSTVDVDLETESSKKPLDVIEDSIEDINQIEMDLLSTQCQMNARLLGLQGIDLMTEGFFAAGFKLIQRSAAAGDAESLYNMGVAYDSGLFRSRNTKKARKYYEKAARLDHAAAMYNLALLLDLDAHRQEYEGLMKRAASLGLPEALSACELNLSKDLKNQL